MMGLVKHQAPKLIGWMQFCNLAKLQVKYFGGIFNWVLIIAGKGVCLSIAGFQLRKRLFRQKHRDLIHSTSAVALQSFPLFTRFLQSFRI